MATTTTTKKPTSKRSPVKPVEPVTKAGGAVEAVAAGTRLVHEISPSLIAPHPKNPRKDLGDLTELADSIRAHGIQQPITVVPRADKDGEYYALLGHRRLAAAKEVNLIAVPVIITPGLDDAAQLEMMLIENLQRLDLTISEEGAGYQGLLDLGATQTAIAKRTGRAKSTVATRVRIASLPEGARYHVDHHQITIEEALALADLEAADAELYAQACESLANPHVVNPRAAVAEVKSKFDQQKRLTDATAEWAAKGWALKVGQAPDGAHRLSRYGNAFMSPDDHVDCPAGELYIDAAHSWWIENAAQHGRYCCTEAEKYHAKELAVWEAAKNAPPVPRELTPEERERANAHEAERAAKVARHEFLADVFTADSDAAQPLVDYVARLADAIASGVTSDFGDEMYVARLAEALPRTFAVKERAIPFLLVHSLDLLFMDAWFFKSYFADQHERLQWALDYMQALADAGHTFTESEQALRDLAQETADEAAATDEVTGAAEGDES